MKPILVATDLSERADRAIERAFLLGSEHGAEVVVLTVLEEALAERLGADVTKATRDRLTSHVASLAVAHGVPHRVEVALGKPYREILAQAAQCNPELIVMGMHRENGLLDLFRGTTVARVARGGVWPVLLVRDHPDRPYQRALVAVDFSDASRRALQAVRRLAPAAERWLVHAYTVPFRGYIAVGADPGAVIASPEGRAADAEARREMAAFLESVGPEPNPPIVAEGGVLSVLHRARAEVKPDLIAVGRHGRPGLLHAILGSVAEELLRDPPCDLLVA
ncbi:MAG: universal stress protein [Alphaproteobacteria bacterium]|nr:MAG: universal stress protein [Alphaproteobacteria bacterium]